MKIEVNDWKEFRIGDFFEVEYGSFIAQKDSVNESDGFPHVTTSGINNGISYYVENSMFGGNCITVASDGAMGASFYQANPYSASNIVSNLVPKDNAPLNEYNAQFICSLLRKESEKYSWGGFKFSVGRVRETSILLPATPSGSPDWSYMEVYMKEMEEKAKERLDRLEEIRKQEKKKIDVSGWGEFKVGELFDVYLSKDDIQPKHLQEGDTPLISSGKEKNGITAYITDDDAQLWDANTLTVDMFGKVFYQNAPYYCVSHGRVNILYPKTKLNEKILLFIASVIEQVSVNKYNFTDMCTAGKIKNDVLLLPVTSAGDPDWAYMEQYMREMEEKARKRLERLVK